MAASMRKVVLETFLKSSSRHVLTKCASRRLCQSNNQSIKALLQRSSHESNVITKGWVKSVRRHKQNLFVHLNDGSCATSLQVLLQPHMETSDLTYGSCIQVKGELVESQFKGQKVELIGESVNVLGSCDSEDYPFKYRQHHPTDYVRQYLHLRPKTNTFSSLLRLRSAASSAIHSYFQREGYTQIHTPIITSNDCEGAGEIFQVEPANPAIMEDDRSGESSSETTDSSRHFFNVPSFLTVSGQLHLEVANGAIRKVYTFGPTFRAENSRGRHHLSEFYMVEAELAFTNSLEDVMQVMEGLVKESTEKILRENSDDLNLYHKNSEQKEMVHRTLEKDFKRISYTEAIERLESSNASFETKVQWGCDLHKEHERHLVKKCGNLPVFVTDFPASLKPFYARENGDGKTSAAVDLLLPDVGEVCGGSLREERLDVLEQKLDQLGIQEGLQWYVDLRRYGSAPHGGFGLGFERYLQWLLGITNIKDTIPFPRSTHQCKM